MARAILFLFVVLGGVGTYIAHFIKGADASQLNPKGQIAAEQSHLMYFSAAIVLAVAVPTVLTLYFIAWKYRESNNHVTYKPGARNGKVYVFSIWALPTLIMFILAMVLVPVTHHLDPKKTAVTNAEPVTIQVVALRWKWLFLYPEQQIATVNTVTIPKDQPVVFELTADDAPMSSFWIPNLGGQLYAMTGHINRLNLVGNTVGNYRGSSAEINGPGFAGMTFTAHVTSQLDFKKWVNTTKNAPARLDTSTYAKLLQPSEDEPATSYSTYASDLYSTIVMKYMGAHGSHQMDMSHEEGHNE